MQVVTNQYHIDVITRLIQCSSIYQKAPVFYIVERIRQMFPEYKDLKLKDDLTRQVDNICLNVGH